MLKLNKLATSFYLIDLKINLKVSLQINFNLSLTFSFNLHSFLNINLFYLLINK